jgi:hypothetical protein
MQSHRNQAKGVDVCSALAMISLGRSTASYWAAGMWPRVQNLILSVWPEEDVEADPQDDRAACGSRTPPFPADLPARGSHRNGGQATSPPPPYVLSLYLMPCVARPQYFEQRRRWPSGGCVLCVPTSLLARSKNQKWRPPSPPPSELRWVSFSLLCRFHTSS